MDSGDNRNAPFVIIDKVAASAYAFDRNGTLLGTAPVLLGLAIGDESPPGIGDKPLSAIRTEERTTAAGRYVGELGYNLRGEDVLWVDYDSGLSLHRVLTTNPREHRAQRLATPTPLDNRVSYGCINVPVRFFENVIRPAFQETKGMVYVLPEMGSAQALFGAYDVENRARREAVLQTAAASPSR
ncbi:MAG TPA: L,D-transpeptidase [Burkholderiales bacterium]|nr:L,D-transpeptidase [Burkholderiales bacterium]